MQTYLDENALLVIYALGVGVFIWSASRNTHIENLLVGVVLFVLGLAAVPGFFERHGKVRHSGYDFAVIGIAIGFVAISMSFDSIRKRNSLKPSRVQATVGSKNGQVAEASEIGTFNAVELRYGRSWVHGVAFALVILWSAISLHWGPKGQFLVLWILPLGAVTLPAVLRFFLCLNWAEAIAFVETCKDISKPSISSWPPTVVGRYETIVSYVIESHLPFRAKFVSSSPEVPGTTTRIYFDPEHPERFNRQRGIGFEGLSFIALLLFWVVTLLFAR